MLAENTHEPIISLELWERVQALLNKKHKSRQRKDGERNLFTGLLHCADCGYKFRGQYNRLTRANGSEYFRNYYTCGTYARSGKAACSMHYILEKTLIEIVVQNIRKHAQLVEQNEERIIEAIVLAQSNETMSYRAAYKSEVEAHKKQIAKLDVVLENLYSDKVTGVISEEMFKRFAAKYEQERVDCLQSVETLEKRIAAIKESGNNTVTWAKLIKSFSQLETLDADTLFLLINKIVIGESKHDGKACCCDINIFYNYVGDIDRLGLNDIIGRGVTEYERQVV